MAHLTFEQLVDYVEGRLAPAELADVQTHLSTGCATCQADLAWLEQTLGAIAADTWISPPPEMGEAARQLFPVPAVPAATSIWQRPLVWGTAVFIAALLLFSWLYFSLLAPIEPELTPAPTATVTPVSPTPTPEEWVVTAVPATPTPSATATTVATTTGTPTSIPTDTVTPTPMSTATLTATAVPPTLTSAPPTQPPPPPSQPTPPPDDDDDGDDDGDGGDDDD